MPGTRAEIPGGYLVVSENLTGEDTDVDLGCCSNALIQHPERMTNLFNA